MVAIPADSIIFPDVPIALRLSSHLMLGVVRIYSWKVSNLLLSKLNLFVFVCRIHHQQACPPVEPQHAAIIGIGNSSMVCHRPHRQVWLLMLVLDGSA